MITYTYRAKRLVTGEVVEAEVQADTVAGATVLLTKQNLFPIDIQVKEEGGGLEKFKLSNRVRAKDKVILSRQLSTLINSGLPLVQSLKMVRSQLSSKKLQEVLGKVIASVEGGSKLSSAFAEHPAVFNETFISLVAAGESSGNLDKTLERLATQQEKDAALAAKIRGAMIYPLIVFGVIIAVLSLMLTTVLPQVGALYKDLKRDLPIFTRILLSLSNFVTRFWWLVVVMLGLLGYGIRNYIKTEKGRRWLDTIKLRIPLFSRLVKKIYMARLCLTLSTLIASGLPILQALKIVSRAVGNVLIEDSLQRAMNEVKAGKALSDTLENDPNIPALVPQMIKIGEQSGTLDEMLAKLSDYYQAEVDEEIKNLSTTIEPAMMILLGVVVAFVVAAILLPVYSLVGQGVT